MKLTLLLQVFAMSTFTAGATAPKVSISLNNVKVEKVLSTITKQTGLSVDYSEQIVDTDRKVSIRVQNEETSKVMELLVMNTNLDFEIKNNKIHLFEKQSKSESAAIVQQKKQISGIVVDQNGDPIIGANIVEKGTTNGTITSIDGQFSIEASGKSILVISYIGFVSQEIDPKNNTSLRIILKENNEKLDEVVVVGYGAQKKTSLTGAISTIKTEDITQNVTSNLSNVLSGRLSGVFSRNTSGIPGSGSSIQIRGFSTLNNNAPLSIVDGVERDYSNIDPNEIASISVLKDAASAAVYGSRAANGVILVTTKRGETGKPVLNYSGTVGFQSPTSYPEMMSPYEFATMKNKSALNMGYDQSNPAHINQFVSDEELNLYRTGQKGADWWKICMNNIVPQTQHNLNINGGNEKIRYFFSAGYLNQTGMFDNISFERYNFRSNVDAEISKGLTVNVSIDGRISNRNTPGYDPNFIFLYLTVDPLSFGFTPDNKPIDTGAGNPYPMIHNSGYNKNRDTYFQGKFTLDYEIPHIKGLTAKGLFSYEKNYAFNKRFTTPYLLYFVNDKNEVISSRIDGSQTSLNQSFNDIMNYNLNLSLNYNNSFGKHNISGMFLYEQLEGFGDNFWASRVNYIANSIDQLFAGGDVGKDNNGSGFETGRQSLISRISYNYDNKYYIEGSFRYDGSVNFSKGNRWGRFPSISASWRISEEQFIKNSISNLDNLKLRASYGILGNDRVSPFQYADYYRFASGAIFDGNISTGIAKAPLANSNITWEKAKTLDIGVEASLWKGLLSVEFDYFYKRTSDILAKKIASTPGTFGASLPDVNYAIVDNKGVDMLLRHDNKINKVSYFVSSTLSFARNKVIRIDDPANQKDYLLRVGKPISFVTGYKSLGLFQSDEEASNYMTQFGTFCKAGDVKYADINEDGKIDEDDQTRISKFNGTPEFFYGLNLGVSWNGFELNAQLQGAANNIFIYDGRAKTLFVNSVNNAYRYLTDTWSPENTNAQYPRAWQDLHPNNSKYSDFWLRNAAYLKLRNLEFAYNIPRSVLRKASIDRIRLFITATDLLTIKGDMEFDPEAASMNYYPQQKTVNFGLNLTF